MSIDPAVIQHLHAAPDGTAHFDSIELPLSAVDFAPPAPKIFVSAPTSNAQHVFLRVPVGWHGDLHPAPARQLMTMVRGKLEVTLANGVSRVFSAGDVALVEDTHGSGHATSSIGDEDAFISVVQF